MIDATFTSFNSSTTEPSASTPAGSGYNTGHLRRTYDFSSQLVRLTPSAHPYYTFVSKLGRKPTPDYEFKYAEERSTVRKRHGYVMQQAAWNGTASLPTSFTAFSGTASTGQPLGNSLGDTFAIQVSGDIKFNGSFESVYGNSNSSIIPGDTDTAPRHFLVGQIIRIPLKTTALDKLDADGSQNSGNTNAVADDYMNVKVLDVDATTVTDRVTLGVSVVKEPKTTSMFYTTYCPAGTSSAGNYSLNGSGAKTALAWGSKPETFKEKFRVIVVGTSFAQGSGYPTTWADQPYSTGIGQTQIFKTVMEMENTIRATELKYAKNEWARIYSSKMLEHKDDIERAGLFGKFYTDGKTHYTQGIIDKVLDAGHMFTMDLANKTLENFMDDLDILLDPRTNNAKPTVFMADSITYNWIVKASGLFSNTIQALASGASNANISAEFSIKENKSFFGVPTRIISTPSGDIKVVKNANLDGTNIHMIGVDLSKVKYRPLVGNGYNRDTKLYVGVKTIENSGEDVRVDLIQTEAGFEITAPEHHAVWVG